ncbi:hypothetical protein FOL47_003590 [Perkinsus chesapeaki]|uniref:C2H2-type domain-containing protein n=1 Tax=Perkinsus chesapeaki TaxID=330153 RepID=A0A7J6M7A9_PERCH|nr:hypothetical protein FOL47_003590 [Perkinsus chesapeaki]
MATNTTATVDPADLTNDYRCNACNMDFEDSARQRDHYKSDFHVYNTKRKVAGLAPISLQVWTLRMEQLKKLAAESGDNKGTAHLKHREEGAAAMEHKEKHVPSQPPVEIVRDDKTCLFDNTQHKTVEDNLAYMSLKYSFFIPEIDYLKDLTGLLAMLTDKIYDRHQCLYCNKIYGSVGAVKSHMLDMKHTRIGTDTDELLADLDPFYDFSTSYLELQGGGPVEETEECDSDDDSDDWTEIGSVSGDEEEEDDLDEAVMQTGLRRAQILDDGSLRLPNGKVATHRMYAYIYKQRLTNDRVGDKPHEARKTLPQQKNAMLAIAGGDQSSAIMSMKTYREQKREAKSLLKSMKFMDFEAQKAQVRSNMLQKSRKGRTNRQNVTLWTYAKANRNSKRLPESSSSQ